MSGHAGLADGAAQADRRIRAKALVPLPRVVARVSEELAELAAMVGTLQDLVAVPGRIDADDPDFIASAQDFDLLTQRLAGLGQFMRELAGGLLADGMPADGLVDPGEAARAVTLTKLRARLSFRDVDAGDPTDVELF